eukprot:CAMPEP_0184234008 /NCGR_PEP_ID=MMETSP0976-20121227/24590_1 /TAXON_ID=483370 /ORGANISM="non described non described, Strain CCMP2097" /LENGTH=84 /DNA_ID=CAMNT_0026539063 /DNA_START=35 /DNA_END=285 /DNA_ORIENTATION=+
MPSGFVTFLQNGLLSTSPRSLFERPPADFDLSPPADQPRRLMLPTTRAAPADPHAGREVAWGTGVQARAPVMAVVVTPRAVPPP